jgi:hypothetical protein
MKWLEWRDYLYKLSDILQCENCDPSADLWKYIYKNGIWKLQKMGKNCTKCNSIIWSSIDDTNFLQWDLIIQCIKCDPSLINNHIKFKYNGLGWNIDKIYKFVKSKHIWTTYHWITDINYECSCSKCIK